MGRRFTVSWYITAWLVAMGAVLAMLGMLRITHGVLTPPMAFFAAYLVLIGASFVMFASWLATLARLAQLKLWAWVMVVLVLQLCGLGIIGMAAYAYATKVPKREVVFRPSVT